jgi:hypothetical protein
VRQGPHEATRRNYETSFIERGEADDIVRGPIWHLLIERRDPLGLRGGGRGRSRPTSQPLHLTDIRSHAIHCSSHSLPPIVVCGATVATFVALKPKPMMIVVAVVGAMEEEHVQADVAARTTVTRWSSRARRQGWVRLDRGGVLGGRGRAAPRSHGGRGGWGVLRAHAPSPSERSYLGDETDV